MTTQNEKDRIEHPNMAKGGGDWVERTVMADDRTRYADEQKFCLLFYRTAGGLRLAREEE